MKNSTYILAVDDNSAMLILLRRILEAEGYQVLTTQSPIEAIALLSKHPIDVLISDIEMPGVSGLELVDLARREFPEVVRILLTGHTSTKSVLRAVNEGHVFRYLQKPCENKKIVEVIREAVSYLITLRQGEPLSRQQQQRLRLKDELEKEHPGLCTVAFQNGAYVLDVKALTKLLAQLEHPLAALIKSNEGAFEDAQGDTQPF